MRTTLIAVVIGVVHLAVAGADAQTALPQQAPTFRSGVDLVAVDVSAIGRNGRPVSDLTREEFSLEVDGRARRIVSAEYVATRRLDDNVPERGVFSSNQGQPPGRLIMLVIDEGNIRRGTAKSAFEAASKFIDTLSRSDRVALHLMPGAGPVVNFTANHALVKGVLLRAVGHAVEAERSTRVGVSEALQIIEQPPPPDGILDVMGPLASLYERECAGERDATSINRCREELKTEARIVYTDARSRASRTFTALRGIVELLALTPEPKTMVLITEGVLVGRNLADLAWVGPRTAAAHVSMYGLRVDSEQFDAGMNRISPTRKDDRALLSDGLDLLVGAARGSVFPMAVNANAVFSRLEMELSGYYLLSFEPDLADRDGQAHRIGVKVSRAGITLRARREFAVDAASGTRTTEERLIEALRSPLLASEFGLKATTFVFRDDTTGKLKVIVSAELDRAFNPAGAFALAYYLTDAEGKIAAMQVEEAIDRPAKNDEGRPQTYSAIALVEPGMYNLKLAAVDPAGRRASVEHAFDAKLTAIGQLRLGDLMLAQQSAPGRAPRPAVDGEVRTDVVLAYIELYSEALPQLESATLVIEIASGAGTPPLETMPMRFVDDSVPGKRSAEASVPVALLPPGAYVARAILRANGRDVGSVTRPFAVARATLLAPASSRSTGIVPFTSTIDAFDRATVLTRPVVGFFLDRLTLVGQPALPDPLTPALGLTRAGRFSEALRITDAASSTHYAASFFSGLAHLAQGERDRAATSFGATLSAAPAFFPAAFYLGACYAAAGRDRDAVIAWRSALVTERDAPWVHTLLIDALLRLRETAQAIGILNDAVRLWPDNDDVRMRMGTALSLSGQGAEAVRVLDPYVSRHPADQDRLLLIMRMIYETRAAGGVVDSAEADRARFARYFTAYEKTGGPALAQAAEWKRFVDR